MTRATPSLDRVLAELRTALDRPAEDEHCRSVRPRADGTLAFAWRLGGRALTVELRGAAAAADGLTLALGRQALVALGAAPTDEHAARVLKRLANEIVGRWRGDLGRWLAPGSDPRATQTVQRSPRGLAAALSSKLVPGLPFWRGWALERLWHEAHGDTHGFVLAFERRGHGHVRALLGEAPEAPRLCDTPLGAFLALPAHPAAGPTERERAAVLEAAAFLVGRCLGPGARWASSPPPHGTDGPDEGLIDYCYRGSIESYRVPSRFFDLWGYPDSFGTAAENGRRDGGILHLTRECPIVQQVTRGRGDAGVRPWGAEAFRARVENLPVYTTDLDDVSLALGGEQKLSQLFAAVRADHAGRAGGADFLLVEGCESHIIGDSPAAVGRQCLHGSDLSLTALQSRLPNFEEADTRSSWARMLDDVVASRGPREPASVNLFGYGSPDEPCVRDLVAVLADVGVRVEGVVMPALQRGVEARLAAAALSLVSPWHPVHDLVTRPMAERGLPHLEPPLPLGWTATLRWVGTVCEALGLPAPSDLARTAWWGRVEAQAGPTLEALRREPLRLGVVADLGTPTQVASPAFFFGGDLLDLARDPGVQLTLVHLPHASEWRRAQPADVARLAHAGVRVVEHAAGTPLVDVVADLGLEVVYCDLPAARDVKRAGASPVAITALRPGPAGFAAWLNHLAALRRMQLYRRHGARL